MSGSQPSTTPTAPGREGLGPVGRTRRVAVFRAGGFGSFSEHACPADGTKSAWRTMKICRGGWDRML